MFPRKISVISLVLFGFVLFTPSAFAHVIVYPHQVGIAATQDFTVSVPNERDNPVVSVRLLIPKGVTSVVPNAISGWTITTKSSGKGDNAAITEIDWSSGTIPVGQRGAFIFQAQVPAEPTTLAWKAYQTYSDGTVVSWDVNPATMENLSDSQQDQLAEKEHKGEYSTTQVINDLAASNTDSDLARSASQSAQMAELFSLLAVVLSAAALYTGLRKRK